MFLTTLSPVRLRYVYTGVWTVSPVSVVMAIVWRSAKVSSST